MSLQVVLLAIGLSGLGFVGLGIDYIRSQVQEGARAPRWPFGLHPPDDWPQLGVLGLIAGLILGLALLRAVINYTYTVQANRLVQSNIVVNLRDTVYNKLQRLSFRFYDDNASGTIINRVTRDVQATRMFIDGVIIQSIIMVLSLTVYVTYMLNIHVWLTLACLATTPLLWFVSTAFSRKVKPAYQHNRELMDDLVLRLSESLQGVHVIKGFAREKEATERFREANGAVREQSQWIFGRVSRFSPLIGFIAQINILILLAYGGYLVINDQLPLGTGLIVFAGLLQQFSGQVANISNIANSIQESLTGARRVFEVLDEPVEIRDAPSPVPLGRAAGAVRFENVVFGYDPPDVVLQDVSFEAQPGQCIAILGATGAGKSTLMSLIPRFYDPWRGRVLVDGADVRRFAVDDLRRNVGIVFQENFLFSNTIAANIAFGHPGATRGQIEAAAKIAAAHEFIMATRKGYDSVLEEGGGDLSGGQRQRIAIARALLLQPPILLLDDPTAAIDPDTEHEIMEAMDSAMQGRTTFVVAHRLSTLRRADMIIVLDRGRIVQCGTHDELMNAKGPYQRVATLQVVDDESRRLLDGNHASGAVGGNQ
ncbi:ABC transporter ATP-binding protein [bacterium]|nr:ABC transporter ATP-binding protein [bacterium]